MPKYEECKTCGAVLPKQETTRSDYTIPVDKQIGAYMHCSLCLQEGLPQNIEAGWTRQGFQVWCRNHNVNIIHVDFQGQRHPANCAARNPKDVS